MSASQVVMDVITDAMGFLNSNENLSEQPSHAGTWDGGMTSWSVDEVDNKITNWARDPVNPDSSRMYGFTP